ncbi:hypothetical protein [Micromonospora sp. NPDC092111]|uniref:hypothetical protein n=1 Tax=Micromonospora sp. NPDC092111 TaxID=3364289 RepID=UPI0037F7DEE2
MTVSVLAGLAMQSGAIAAVHVGVRGQWTRRPGALLLAVAVLFHGTTELMQSIWPGRNFFRAYVDQQDIDDWMLLVSASILLYSAAYLLGIHLWQRFAAQERLAAQAPGDGRGLTSLRLRWLLPLTLPLLVATWQGRGALQPVAPLQAAQEGQDERAGLLAALAGGFLVPLIAVIGATIMVRYGARWLVPVLAVEGLALAVAGTRSMIVFAVLLTLVGAALHGVRPTRRQVAGIVLVVAAFCALISSTRAVAGREVFDANQKAGDRIQALVDGGSSIHTERSRSAILDDLVYRFDGNTFGAAIFNGLQGNTPPVGLVTVRHNLMMLTPSIVNSDKVAANDLKVRSEEAYLDAEFGLSQYVDWLPTIFGTVVAYDGWPGLLLVAAVLGALLATVEGWALAKFTTARVVLLVGLAHCALLYESGPQMVLTTLRLTPVLVVGLAAVGWIRQRWPRRDQPARPATSGPGAVTPESVQVAGPAQEAPVPGAR